MLAPGGTIGILGGGQLGRMLAMSAAQLGYRCVGYAPAGDNVAAQVSSDFVCGSWDDAEALARFKAQCDVITWEFENVPIETLGALDGAEIYPRQLALETAQDRANEKRFVEKLGGTPAPWRPVQNRDEFADALEVIGAPGILKTRRDGYDGKGQWRLSTTTDAQRIDLPTTPMVYEGFVDFAAEFSVILVRAKDGEVRFWDSPRNEHEGGILARSFLPAGDVITAQVQAARALASEVADALAYVGVLTLEFFATSEGPVFNEMAPRVHNSGHWTIEGAATSQFENHIRAIAGLPLGNTDTLASSVEMLNIVGHDGASDQPALAEPRAHLHLYGKAEAREGRKMGHITRLAGE